MDALHCTGITTKFSMDGYWGSWKPLYNWAYYGTPDDFIVYAKHNHPSNYCFHIRIKNFNPQWVQNNEYQSYAGTIAYTTSLNAYDIAQNSKWFVDVELGLLSHGEYSRTRSANIRIQKTGKLFYYNIFFDDVGFGITIPWKKY